MVAKVEAAKQMIEKTKKEIREEERKREIIQKFKDLYGFQPDRVWWTDNFTLKANSVINFDDFDDDEEIPTIMEKPVKEVQFWVEEEKIDMGYDMDWNFSKSKEGLFIRYELTRGLRKYMAVVEIITST